MDDEMRENLNEVADQIKFVAEALEAPDLTPSELAELTAALGLHHQSLGIYVSILSSDN